MPKDFKHITTSPLKRVAVLGKETKPCQDAGTELCISFEYIDDKGKLVYHDIHITDIEAKFIMKKLQSQMQLNQNVN